jgi:hypothetical protein
MQHHPALLGLAVDCAYAFKAGRLQHEFICILPSSPAVSINNTCAFLTVSASGAAVVDAADDHWAAGDDADGGSDGGGGGSSSDGDGEDSLAQVQLTLGLCWRVRTAPGWGSVATMGAHCSRPREHLYVPAGLLTTSARTRASADLWRLTVKHVCEGPIVLPLAHVTQESARVTIFPKTDARGACTYADARCTVPRLWRLRRRRRSGRGATTRKRWPPPRRLRRQVTRLPANALQFSSMHTPVNV